MEEALHAEAMNTLRKAPGEIETSLASTTVKTKQYANNLREIETALESRLQSASGKLDAEEAEARRRARAEQKEASRKAEDDARKKREVEEKELREQEERRLRGDDPLHTLVKPLLDRCAGNGKPFTDPDFPASDSVLPPQKRGTKWARARDIMGKNPKIFSKAAGDDDPIDPEDISQGELGTCYFLSALSVAATKPYLIRSCFVTNEANEHGVFCVRFFFDGKPRHILVDDQFPISRFGKRPCFASSKQGDELWVSILEKAYAKLYKSYGAIEGGLVDEALVNITGGIGGQSVKLRKEIVEDAEGLWAKLRRNQAAGWLMGAGSPSGSDTDISERGIVQGHAYSLLRVEEADGHKLVQLRNPWGRTEWKGDWSDKSRLWTPRLKAQLGWEEADDGTFWMALTDFAENFASLYICKIPSPSWKALEVKGEWRGKTAGGCCNHPSFGDNPQYLLTVKRPTHVLIALAQSDVRGSDCDFFPISLNCIFDKGGGRVQRLLRSHWSADTPIINSREVSLDCLLEMKGGGKMTTYTLIPSTWDPGQEREFHIRVFADSQDCSLEPA